MAQNPHRDKPLHEGLITALAFGGFLIILGAVFGLTPGVPTSIIDFFGDLSTASFPFGDGTISLLAPAQPATHAVFYGAVFNFMIGIAILQIVILALRLALRSTINKIAETIGNLVFWLGGAIAANIYLLAGTQIGWFQFWTWLIIIIGVSLVARFLVYLAKRF